MEARVPARLTPAEGRRFGLTVGAAFLALAALLWWRGRPTGAAALGALGAALVLAGLAVPEQLGPVHRAWMGLAHAISRVTTPIVLGLLYLLVFAPLGALRRLAGRNPLVRREGPDGYWVVRTPEQRRSDLARQF